MNIRVGYIPYINMAPFHQGFGPFPVDINGHHITFQPVSPRALGLEAEKDALDAGAMSLVDCFRLSNTFEPVGNFGIGLKRDAQSVLLFSKKPISDFSGDCAVTDETSTSFRLLQLILEGRYGRTGIRYGRIASSMLFDGNADGLLLIGDEALRAKAEGLKGFPVVTDLGQEWYAWQKLPFVFARWMIRRKLPSDAKELVKRSIQKSLDSVIIGTQDQQNYWDGFAYKLLPEHERSIAVFANLMEKACTTASR